MAIQYILKKKKDIRILEVSQNTTYILTYISDKSNAIVEKKDIEVNTPYNLAVTKDGKYTLTLKAENENDVIITFDSIKNLQNSIITDAKVLLCEDCGCGCDDDLTANCISKAAKRCLYHKSIFNKLLAYQTLGVPTYGNNYTLIFANFITQGVLTYECKAQTAINNIILEECITGSVKDVEKLFTLYLALYWAGMYFIEYSLADTEEERLFVKEKYSYDTIIGCLCRTCINMQDLELIFNSNPLTSQIFSFQFDSLTKDINDVGEITDEFLSNNGTAHTEVSLLEGKQITYNTLGRVGFVIKNTLAGKHNFLDVLGNNITSVFDVVYDANTFTEIFVTKEYVTPSTIYYKLLKL